MLNAKGATRLLSLAIPESTKLLGGVEGSCVKRLDVSKPIIRPAPSLSTVLSRARVVVRHFSQILLDGDKSAKKQRAFGENSVDFCHGALRMLHTRGLVNEAETVSAAPLLKPFFLNSADPATRARTEQSLREQEAAASKQARPLHMKRLERLYNCYVTAM